MTLDTQKKLVKHIFRLLKVNEIIIPIGRTNKGNLGFKFTQNSEDFEIYLDAVPLSTKDILADDNNIELKKILEKYLFGDEILGGDRTPRNKMVQIADTVLPLLKRGGRPKGSKNKNKDVIK